MAEVIRMPKMSDTMTEGVITKWHKKVGDSIGSGDLLAEIETDKATMDLESYYSGSLLHIGIAEGEKAAVDSLIAIVGNPGENYKELLAEGDNSTFNEEKSNSLKRQVPLEPSQEDVAVIRMPLLSDTMEAGIIVEWHKKIGDSVKSDDVLAEVETDKAVMEVVGYADGTLLYVGVEKGQSAKVNDIIAIVGKKETDISSVIKNSSTIFSNKSSEKTELFYEENDQKKLDQNLINSSLKRLKASPLARKIAKERKIDLETITGSAEGGRIIKKDLENNFSISLLNSSTIKHSETSPTELNYTEKFVDEPISQMRKVIGKRLSESFFNSPHFYLTISIDMEQAIVSRENMNEFSSIKISFNDIIIKAVALALKQHPQINSSWLNDKIRYNKHVHIGVALAVDDGLLVPIVRFADQKSLSIISSEVRNYAKKSKEKKLQPKDWEGSTFTISNLGMLGIEEFTAIINPPNSCILAIGSIQKTPVIKNDQIVPGNVLKITLGCDHRVVDGATGAAFLQTLKQLIEQPIKLLV